MEAIERVDSKCWIWKSFVEAARILIIEYDMNVLKNLTELGKTPVKMFVYDWEDYQVQCV